MELNRRTECKCNDSWRICNVETMYMGFCSWRHIYNVSDKDATNFELWDNSTSFSAEIIWPTEHFNVPSKGQIHHTWQWKNWVITLMIECTGSDLQEVLFVKKAKGHTWQVYVYMYMYVPGIHVHVCAC